MNFTLKEKYISGNKNPIPISRPRNLCAHSHQKIILNSSNVMLKFCNLNSGISLYKLKYNIQSFWFSGGSNPENNCHSVIESPESVSLVKPPTTIIMEMIINIVINQKDN